MAIRKIKTLTMLMVVLIGSVFNVSSVFADFDGMDTVMTISPPSQRMILTPGEDYEASISVSNSSNAKYDLNYSVVVGSLSYAQDEDGNTDYGDLGVDEVTSYNQIMNWIELKKDRGTIAVGGLETIPFVIHVPENAPAGGQYATIIVQNDSVGTMSGEGIAIESAVRFASNIIAEVTGETVKEGNIPENNIPSFLLTNQLLATSLVRNNGNIHTDAEYTLQVWPLFSDEEICTNEENISTSLIMPETERYHTESCNLPAVGIFRAKQIVKIFGETSIVEKTVIVCPLWLLFLIIFGIAAIIIYFVTRAKARKKNAE